MVTRMTRCITNKGYYMDNLEDYTDSELQTMTMRLILGSNKENYDSYRAKIYAIDEERISRFVKEALNDA